MATLTKIVPNVTTGTVFTADAAVGPDDFVNTGKEMLYVANGGGSSITVTIASVENCSYGFDHDVVATVANGVTRVFGPFDTTRFNDGASKVSWTYSGTTSVTVAVISTS